MTGVCLILGQASGTSPCAPSPGGCTKEAWTWLQSLAKGRVQLSRSQAASPKTGRWSRTYCLGLGDPFWLSLQEGGRFFPSSGGSRWGHPSRRNTCSLKYQLPKHKGQQQERPQLLPVTTACQGKACSSLGCGLASRPGHLTSLELLCPNCPSVPKGTHRCTHVHTRTALSLQRQPQTSYLEQRSQVASLSPTALGSCEENLDKVASPVCPRMAAAVKLRLLSTPGSLESSKVLVGSPQAPETPCLAISE